MSKCFGRSGPREQLKPQEVVAKRLFTSCALTVSELLKKLESVLVLIVSYILTDLEQKSETLPVVSGYSSFSFDYGFCYVQQ